MTEQGKQTLSGGHEQMSLMKDEQGKTTLACGHECTLYAGMAMSTSGSCWSKRSTKCCECMHTATEEPCIYIDGLGEQTCPRWQFYCAACVSRCAPDGGTMWDAGKMTRVLVFEPGTRMLMNAAPKAVTQTAAASQAKVAAAAAAVTAAAAPAAWLGVARQTLLAVKLAEQAQPVLAEQAQPVLAEQAQPVLAEQAQPVLAEQAQPALVPPRNAAAAAASHRKRSQPTARKPRHPGLARDDDERVAAPEARPAHPRQPRQRRLWSVGTCMWCSAALARSGVGQVLVGREASARAPRRRQAWASSEEQYCVACWDEHLGVGAEADEAEAEVAEAMKRLEEAEVKTEAEAEAEAAAAEAEAAGWVDVKGGWVDLDDAAAGWEALSCAGSEAATECTQLSEHTEAWETDSMQLDLAGAEAGAEATEGAEVPGSAAALESVAEGEACMSWAERARTPGMCTTPLSVTAGMRAALASVTVVAGQANRRKTPWQLPKGVRAPPKRQLQRWGEVAFAFH